MSWHLRKLISPTFLFCHIYGIVFLGAKKKVIRVYARWIIAMVKNAKTFWNWTTKYHPGCSMRIRELSSSQHDVTITKPLVTANPDPAMRSLFYIFKEPVLKRHLRSKFFPSSIYMETSQASFSNSRIGLICDGSTAIIATFGRMFLHRDLPPCAIPLDANTSQGFLCLGGL
jgi:hypothetical protein